MFNATTYLTYTGIKEDGLEQRLIVTYSIKYRNYYGKPVKKTADIDFKLIEKEKNV